jgi:predicted transcriptional regulator
MIYKYVQNNPGAHLRKISSALDISIGSVQYHLERLVDSGYIESDIDAKYRRFFLSKKFSKYEKILISFMNRPTSNRIIGRLFQVGEIKHQALAEYVGITSQAITWQVKQLIKYEILDSNLIDGETCYFLTEDARYFYDKLILSS